MYVICFYWQGDRWQQHSYIEKDGNYVNRQQPFLRKVGKVSDDLPSRYINNLYHGVKRFADRPFQFVCFTNEPLKVDRKIEIRPFRTVTRMGVLPRLYMFSKEAGLFGHQVLCLDIDVIIVGSLKLLMDYSGLFCARSKFKHGEEYKLDGDIMSFRAGKETEDLFWKPFIKNVEWAEKMTQGRERYWVRYVAEDIADRWDGIAPGCVVSYKRHVRNTKNPPFLPGTSIVSCHGTPRPDQIDNKWIKQYWQ